MSRSTSRYRFVQRTLLVTAALVAVVACTKSGSTATDATTDTMTAADTTAAAVVGTTGPSRGSVDVAALTSELVRAGLGGSNDPLFADVGACRASATAPNVIIVPLPFTPKGTAACTVSVSDHIFVSPAGTVCLADQIGNCTSDVLGGAVKGTVTVDGVAVNDTRLHRVQVDATALTVATGNAFGSPVGTAKGQIAALSVDLGTMAAGTHEIVETGTYGATTLRRTVTITSQ